MIERYTLPEMGALWNEEARFRAWLRVEIAVCRARARLGEIPQEDVEELAEKADFSVERIKEIEEETNHDVIAFVTAVSETLAEKGARDAARHFHFGLTSSDVLDTAGALQLKGALSLIREEAKALTLLLCNMSLAHRSTVMVGRTHGVHAEPTTLGHKLAVWAFEMERNLERLDHAEVVAAIGKISGAVGTYANVDPKVETITCEELGLGPEPASTQVVQRDRHAEILSTFAILGSTMEKIALEVRGAQRTEVRELAEPFRSGQKGSSAMPHKRNPILAERLSGMARLLRGYANVDPKVEALTCEELGLKPAPASTQVIQRDRHAEVLSTIAILGSTMEKIALEIRGAQRTEVRELAEPFRTGQKGSSAMPHKRNPILAERLSGMARLLRGYAGVGFENNALWQERDISHSSAERVALPDSTTLAHYMLRTTWRILDGLQVDGERMLENLNSGGGIVYSGRVLLALVEARMGRDEAYAIVQGAAMRAWGGEGGFRELLEADGEVQGRLGEDFDSLFDSSYALRNLDVVFDRVEDLRRRLESA